MTILDHNKYMIKTNNLHNNATPAIKMLGRGGGGGGMLWAFSVTSTFGW